MSEPGLMEAKALCRPGGAGGGCSAARGALGGDGATSAARARENAVPDVSGQILVCPVLHFIREGGTSSGEKMLRVFAPPERTPLAVI